MHLSPILLLHICGGIAGFLAGAVTMVFRKGSRRHGLAGNVFVISMLTMSATGTYMAFIKSQPTNIIGGTMTAYLVATAWSTARHKDSGTGAFDWRKLLGILDWGSLAVALALVAANLTFGVEAVMSPTGKKFGYPAVFFFVFGSILLIAFFGDIRTLVHRGISATQRTARHLWRMCFAWFFASGSIFLARQHLFPVVLRKTGVLLLLSFLPLLLMFFWLVRIRWINARRRKPISAAITGNSPVKLRVAG